MAEPSKRFEVVQEDDSLSPVPPSPSPGAAVGVLLLALKALSQRALVAIDNLFCLLTVFAVFWLWRSTPDPNVYQITSLALFALFVLAANVIVRRK